MRGGDDSFASRRTASRMSVGAGPGGGGGAGMPNTDTGATAVTPSAPVAACTTGVVRNAVPPNCASVPVHDSAGAFCGCSCTEPRMRRLPSRPVATMSTVSGSVDSGSLAARLYGLTSSSFAGPLPTTAAPPSPRTNDGCSAVIAVIVTNERGKTRRCVPAGSPGSAANVTMTSLLGAGAVGRVPPRRRGELGEVEPGGDPGRRIGNRRRERRPVPGLPGHGRQCQGRVDGRGAEQRQHVRLGVGRFAEICPIAPSTSMPSAR